MFKDKLLVGQYYTADSPVHRLSPSVKILISLIYMISLFVVDYWSGWLFLTAVCVLFVCLSRVPLGYLWQGTRMILVFCLITVLINIFIHPGERLLWSCGFLHLYAEGLSFGLSMGLRLLLLVSFASMLTLTTSPMALTDGLEKLLSPVGKIGFPVHEIAMMMSIALRFIPTILEEMDRIILAQRARGARIGEGNLLCRLKSFAPLVVPMFVSAFRRAEELAQAMDARCYRGGSGRSKWKPDLWCGRDKAVLIVFAALLLLSVAGRIIL